MFHEGDIVEIPLPDGRTAIGWLIHVSTLFKNTVGFLVFGIKGQVREDIVFEENKPKSMKVLGVLYTHKDNLEICGWRVVAHQPVSQSKKLRNRSPEF
jgi:hypothetical protein